MTELDRPLILVTNDDGIDAPGIRFLAEVASDFGDVVVVAPLTPMSGMGHAITVRTPLRYRKIFSSDQTDQYVVEGTPVDCVKTAIRQILGRKPDILLSGINHGSNASVNIIYSGTMAAAFEGAMAGVPSIGFSLMDYKPEAPLKHLRPYLTQMISDTLRNGLPEGVCLNVNFPEVSDKNEILGVRICRQANGYWLEKFEERKDPHGVPYFWLHGDFVRTDHGDDTDLAAVKEGFISVVPVQYDFTARHAIEPLQHWNSFRSKD